MNVISLEASQTTYCKEFGVCDYRRVLISWMDLMTTCIYHSELNFTDHWHTQQLQSPLANSWQRLYQWRFFSFPHPVPLVTAARAEFLSTDNSPTWVPGWRPFHTNLLVFSSQGDFQLTTELSHSPTSYFTSLHSAQLLTTLTNNKLAVSNCPAYNISALTTQKAQPLLLMRRAYWFVPSTARPSVACVRFAGMCLPSRCLAIGIHFTVFYGIPELLTTWWTHKFLRWDRHWWHLI
jgi:hypothetical protein